MSIDAYHRSVRGLYVYLAGVMHVPRFVPKVASRRSRRYASPSFRS